jgi:HD superfamily phosphohydrolase
VVRDLLWRNITLEPAAAAVVETPAFQRLRYVRQLGHAFLVYPGATHSRFEHALGTYHLACRALSLLEERGGLGPLPAGGPLLVRIAALLHDIGHYPFSHALEEAGFASHEELGRDAVERAPLLDALAPLGISAAELGDLITGASSHPLAGLITGSVDLDKLDYLRRDALMCGVPYGEVDTDRLLACLTVAEEHGRRTIGLLEKGLSALESLLFAKYQMYRNVYWHHAVRSATAMFKRLVHEALKGGAVSIAGVAAATDDSLMHDLAAEDPTGLAQALRTRRLYKRVLELTAAEVKGELPDWLPGDAARLARAEDALADQVGLGPAELLIDLPRKQAMLGLDLPIVRRSGEVQRLTQQGWPGRLDLPPLSEDLARSACRLRVFTRRPAAVDAGRLMGVIREAA